MENFRNFEKKITKMLLNVIENKGLTKRWIMF